MPADLSFFRYEICIFWWSDEISAIRSSQTVKVMPEWIWPFSRSMELLVELFLSQTLYWSLKMQRDYRLVRCEVWKSLSNTAGTAIHWATAIHFGNTSSNMSDTSRWIASNWCFAKTCLESRTWPLVCSVSFTELCMWADTQFWKISGCFFLYHCQRNTKSTPTP